MLIDLPMSAMHDEPLPPPAWLVGSIVATVIFVAAAVLASLPHEQPAPSTGADPVLHSGIVQAIPAATPIPFDPINLALPIL